MFKNLAVLTTLILALPAAVYAATSPVAAQLLRAGKIDLTHDMVTLPLRHSKLYDGRDVWYVVIDSSDAADAKAHGLVYAPALNNAVNDPATRSLARNSQGEWVFNQGTVDFSPKRVVVPGDSPNFFPPRQVLPGSVGDANYSPYFKVQMASKTIVYNGPVVAFGVSAAAISFCDPTKPVDHTIVHDKVVRICPRLGLVTLALTHGFADGKALIYVSLESNETLPAALEGATFTPALSHLKGSGATLPLFAVTNGQAGRNNPERQGFNSALAGEGSPLNVLTGIPTLSSSPYTPLWDLHVATWTPAAVNSGQRRVLKSSQQFRQVYDKGLIVGSGGRGIPSSGFLVNCPAIAILQ